MHVLCIRHVAFEDLSAWTQPLAAHGWRIEYCDAGVDVLAGHDPEGPDLLIVQGGPLGVYDAPDYPVLRDEQEFIRRRIEKNLPTIGVCLGSQLLAAAAGAKVYPGNSEVGFFPITLTEAGRRSCLAPFASDPMTLHWHGDTFDLPGGATLLASTALTPHQAFSLGDKILGVQFHPEWGAQPLEPWLIGHTGNLRAQKIDIAKFRAESERLRPSLAAKAGPMLTRYLAAAGLAK